MSTTILLNEEHINLAGLQSATQDDIETWLSSENSLEQSAAILAATTQGLAIPVENLRSFLDDDGWAAQSAAWAIGITGQSHELLHFIDEGGLDFRENAYFAIGIAIAHDRFPALEESEGPLWALLTHENERAASGRTGLGEKVLQLLALQGSSRIEEGGASILQADSYCDRIEIGRLQKVCVDGQADSEGLEELRVPWTTRFAEVLGADEAPIPEREENTEAASSSEAEISPAQPEALTEASETSASPEGAEEAAEDENPEEEMPDIPQLNWEDFLASSEADSLDDPKKQIAQQFGPMIEQIAARYIGKALTDLVKEEVAAIFFQVLPQALPPQVMQMATAPTSLNALSAIGRWLNTEHEAAGFAEGVKLIREEIQAQIRASGGLNSSDYDEPEVVAEG